MSESQGSRGGSAPPDEAPEAPQGRTNALLLDQANNVQFRFLVREIRKRDGSLAAIKSGVSQVRLSEQAGQIAIWGRDDDAAAMITAEGYRACNTVAQVTVLTPPSLELPGLGRVANPHVTFHEETGAYKAGWIRQLAIAPGPTGNLVMTDRSTYLSLVEYLMEDLIGVAKRNPAAACWGVRDVSPADLLRQAVEEHNESKKEEAAKDRRKEWLLRYLVSDEALERGLKRVKKGLWGFYVVEPVTGQGLWFDRMHEAIAGIFRTYAQSGKFGLRKLEAIGYRNVLRDHPLMPGMTLDIGKIKEQRAPLPPDAPSNAEPRLLDRYVYVPVFFHEQVEAEEEIRQLVQDFERGLRTAAFVEVRKDEGQPATRATVQDVRSEGAPEEPEPEGKDEPEPQAKGKGRAARQREERETEVPPEAAKLLVEIATAETMVGSKVAEEAQALFPAIRKDRKSAPVQQLKAYLRALSNAANNK